MAPPVHLTAEPPSAPEPDAGCDVYGALARERTRAAGIGDWSKVADINVEIGRHRSDGRRR